MGYSVSGDSTSNPFRELVYSDVSYMGLSLDYRLQHLQPEEENVVRTVYLVKLAKLETDITNAADNLDTDVAAVWKHNEHEVRDRTKLFDTWRRRLCQFLGFAPGFYLGDGGLRVVRC